MPGVHRSSASTRANLMYSSAQYCSPPSQTPSRPTKAPSPTSRPRYSFSSQRDSPLIRAEPRSIQFKNNAGTPQSCASSLDHGFKSSPLGADGKTANGAGFGNLADELADMWDDDAGIGDEMEECAGELSAWEDSPMSEKIGLRSERIRSKDNCANTPSPSRTPVRKLSLSPHRLDTVDIRTHHKQNYASSNRTASNQDHGFHRDYTEILPSPTTLESCVPELEALIDASLASTNGTPDIHRLATLLCETATQSHLESLVSSYISTHTTLTTSLLQQARFLSSLSSILLSPFSTMELDAMDLTNLLPTTASLDHATTFATLSRRQTGPTPQHHLAALANTTTAVISTLSNLTDALYIEQEISTAFARRLKAVRELVADMKREEEESEAARRWIEEGGWQDRLRGRDCERRCAEVVEGFERVCGGWRERLVAGTV